MKTISCLILILFAVDVALYTIATDVVVVGDSYAHFYPSSSRLRYSLPGQSVKAITEWLRWQPKERHSTVKIMAGIASIYNGEPLAEVQADLFKLANVCKQHFGVAPQIYDPAAMLRVLKDPRNHSFDEWHLNERGYRELETFPLLTQDPTPLIPNAL